MCECECETEECALAHAHKNTHTHSGLLICGECFAELCDFILLDISDFAVCAGKFIDDTFCVLLCFGNTDLMDSHANMGLACVRVFELVPAHSAVCVCASAPPSFQLRPICFLFSSSCCSSLALHISPGENRPV